MTELALSFVCSSLQLPIHRADPCRFWFFLPPSCRAMMTPRPPANPLVRQLTTELRRSQNWHSALPATRAFLERRQRTRRRTSMLPPRTTDLRHFSPPTVSASPPHTHIALQIPFAVQTSDAASAPGAVQVRCPPVRRSRRESLSSESGHGEPWEACKRGRRRSTVSTLCPGDRRLPAPRS